MMVLLDLARADDLDSSRNELRDSVAFVSHLFHENPSNQAKWRCFE
jgi:hypothetical protein